jgi:GNAT superfamily N-acetyltransferase
VTTKSSADPFAITAAAPGDRFVRDEELLRLILDGFEGQRGRVDPPSSAFSESVDNLRRRRQAEWLVIAERAGSDELSACLFSEARPDELYLSKIAVAPGSRGRGLTGRMIERTLPIARQVGCSWLALNVRVSLGDNQAIFRHLGFEIFESGCHPGYTTPTFHRMRRAVTGP